MEKARTYFVQWPAAEIKKKHKKTGWLKNENVVALFTKEKENFEMGYVTLL